MAAADPLQQIAEDYITLAFRLNKHVEGLVDAYYGPAHLQTNVAAEQPLPFEQLEQQGLQLAAQLAEAENSLRVRFLRRQVRALLAQIADAASGQTAYSYLDYVREIYDVEPEAVGAGQIQAYQAEVRRLLNGLGYKQPATQALTAFESSDQLSGDSLFKFFHEQAAKLRQATRQVIPYLPTNEAASIEGVSDKPWGAYNWYLGEFRSRIEINLDIPLNRHNALGLLRHEVYPGHHSDHACHEAIIYRQHGRLEASIKLLNTPDCPVAEGLADVGHLLLEIAHHRSSEAEQLYRTASELRRAVGINAAIMYYTQDASFEDVVTYRMREGWVDDRRARQGMRFVTHPLWRAYVFTYWCGGALIEQAIAAARRHGKSADLIRLLYTELLTPSLLREEMAAIGVRFG